VNYLAPTSATAFRRERLPVSNVERVRRLLLPVLLAALAVPLAGTVSPAAAADVPRVQLVRDGRGDVSASGSIPRSVRRSVDVSSLQVRRDANQLRLRFALRDVRGFSAWEQGATMRFVRGSRVQRFTVAGADVLRGDPLTGRECEDARVTRDTRRDVLVVRLPFECLRTTPGTVLSLRASATAGRVDGGAGSASDRVRAVRTDPR